METKIFHIQNNDYSAILDTVADALIEKKIIIMPSDTIYGFLGLSSTENRIRKIKNRDSKPFLYLVNEYSMLEKLNIALNYDRKFIEKYWPGEVTFIFSTKDNSSVGVRMPKVDFLRKIIGKVGVPLISTSVNITNSPPINDSSKILQQFGELVDVLIINDQFQPTRSSTIVDLREKQYKILRQGSITIQ